MEVLLAHGGTHGSVGEGLLLALPLLVVGVVFLFQKTVKPAVAIGVIAIGIAIVVASMVLAEGDHEAEASQPGGGGRHVSAVTGLCQAQRIASAEPDEAARLFTDEVHVPLHELAAEVEEEDRAAAAAILEAKQTVESDLEIDPLEGDVLEGHLEDLLDATVSGLDAIEVSAATC